MDKRLSAIVGAKISEFRRKMAQVNKITRSTASEVTKPVGADISEFQRKMMVVKKTIALTSKKVVIDIEARVGKFQKKVNRIANFMSSLDTMTRNTGQGALIMMSPGLVPILASAVGLIGTLGPMIGVLAGSTFALGTAFGFAGIAALGFGAAAIPTISKLFDETAELTNQQKAARAEYDKFKSTWQGIVKELEKPVLEAFGKAMKAANKALEMARPMFQGAATAVNNLLDSLNASLDSAPVKAFFDYMNKSAGPLLETLGKAGGNFMQGFMSMMTAFGPLAARTAQGFLDMSKGFADWAAGLSSNKGFNRFVNYIVANMPKIRSIFGDAIVGIVNFFTAFAPLSSDMMTGLQGLMARFKEWSQGLSENQGFQKFLSYIRENAPKVITLIGNLWDFIVNLGVALAPLGSSVLDIVNKFIAWTNTMMENHPWVGKLIAGAILISGALIALVPNILAVTSLFGGFGGALAKIGSKVGPVLMPFLKTVGSTILRLGTTFLTNAARIAASWLIAMGPIGWVIAVVVALIALIIWKWDEIKAWTIKTWNAISTWIVDVWSKISTAVRNKASEIWNTIKQKFSDVVNSIREKMSNVKSKVEEGINKVKSFLSNLDLSSMGKQMIQGLINGIGSMASALVRKAKGVINGAIDGAKKLLGIKSPSRVFMKIGRFTGEGMSIGMDKMRRFVYKSATAMAKAALIEPQRTQFAFDTSLSSSDFGRIRHDIGAEVSDFEMAEPVINVYNEWDGEKVVTYVDRNNANRTRITDGFGGK